MVQDVAIGIILGLLFITLLILFCILLVKLYMNKVQNYTKLIYQKDIDFQKKLNKTILETQEQLLNNISQDLHDDAGQQLTYINFQVENLKLDSPQLEEQLAPISNSLFQLSSSIRNISHSLNNQLLLKQNLTKAIKAEVDRIKQNKFMDISISINEIVTKEFTDNEKIVIYRIFQEILNNCIKHAKAKSIDIHIQSSPKFILKIKDDGNGFDYKTIKSKKNSLGLTNMKQRAKIIHYELKIDSQIGIGTTITLVEKTE